MTWKYGTFSAYGYSYSGFAQDNTRHPRLQQRRWVA